MSIASEITRLQTAKADIKTAIEAKGVTVPSSAKLDDYDTYVSQISGGGGTDDSFKKLLSRTITASDINWSNVSKIGSYGFSYCYNLTSITIPNTLVTASGNPIDSYAFSRCTSLTSITFPNTYIDGWGDPITITHLSVGVCEYCSSLTSVTFPSGLTTIGNNAFAHAFAANTSLTIPNTVTNIENYAFQYCNLTSITLPTSLTTIGSSVFNGCSKLTSLVIPDSVTSIGSSACQTCQNLTTITIGSGISSIPSWFVSSCTSLSTINYTGTKAQWNALTKGTSWKYNVPATVVHCSDGDVTL